MEKRQKNLDQNPSTQGYDTVDIGIRLTESGGDPCPKNPQNYLFLDKEAKNYTHTNKEIIYLCRCSPSNSPKPPSVPHSARCALNRPSGNSKNQLHSPSCVAPNKLVSEYLPDTPALLRQSQRYVTASNSGENS